MLRAITLRAYWEVDTEASMQEVIRTAIRPTASASSPLFSTAQAYATPVFKVQLTAFIY